MIIEFQSTAAKDAQVPAEALGAPLSGYIQVEWLASTAPAVVRDMTVPIEVLAGAVRDWGAAAIAAKIIRRFSRPALTARVRRLFVGGAPAMQGGMRLETLGLRRGDLPAAVEALGASTAITGDAFLAIENAASQRIDLAAPAEVLAASVRDGSDPVEWLTSGTRMIGDAMLPLEWVGAAPAVLVSLEAGPEQIRLLATRGRVRLLRRN